MKIVENKLNITVLKKIPLKTNLIIVLILPQFYYVQMPVHAASWEKEPILGTGGWIEE